MLFLPNVIIYNIGNSKTYMSFPMQNINFYYVILQTWTFLLLNNAVCIS